MGGRLAAVNQCYSIDKAAEETETLKHGEAGHAIRQPRLKSV